MRQADLAEFLGVTKKRVRELRAGIHPDADEPTTKEGWQALLDAANGSAKDGGPPPPPPAVPPPGPVPGGPLLAVVTRKPRNPKVIMAKLKEGGQAITVRVQTSRNFTLGMEIPVLPVTVVLFDLARRGPRWFGKW